MTMTRTKLWLYIMTSCLFYEGARYLLGLEFRPILIFDAVFWSGTTLAMQWKWGASS